MLAAAPELAVLALLDTALDVCTTALLAEHPTLAHDLRPAPEPLSLREARRLIAHRLSVQAIFAVGSVGEATLSKTTWSKVQRVTGSVISRALARAYRHYERRHESDPDFLPLYSPWIWRSYAIEKVQGSRPRLPWLSVLLRAHSNATRRQRRPAWLDWIIDNTTESYWAGRSGVPSTADRPVTPQTPASRFKLLRASSFVGQSGPPATHHALVSTDQGAFFGPVESPLLTLFVSHRWQSHDHADPIGKHAEALRWLLGTVRDLADAALLPSEARISRVPTLATHGVLQAARLLAEFDRKADADWRRQATSHTHLGDEVLRRIGVFFDFSCLPQQKVDSSELQAALLSLPDLIENSLILILREDCDDYDARGWCAAELSLGVGFSRHIVLRSDLIALDFDPKRMKDVRAAIVPYTLEEAINEWRTIDNPWLALKAIWYLYHLLGADFVGVEIPSSTPEFTTRRAPEIFSGHRPLLAWMHNVLENASREDQAMEYGMPTARVHLDVAHAIWDGMAVAGLSCSDERDVVYCALLILIARHGAAPDHHKFYRECLERYLARKSTTLLRFRQRTIDPRWGVANPRAFWVFDDSGE